MKLPISLAVAAVLMTGSFLPATAQAKSKPSHHDDKFRVSSRHHHHHHHDHYRTVKVWVRGHLVWHRGHKHWVPGHYEYRRIYL